MAKLYFKKRVHIFINGNSIDFYFYTPPKFFLPMLMVKNTIL